MTDFQRYMAILDLDGNSWSSRFGELLCYDSVVLKVQPDYVELFFRDLVPGKHYVMIQKDLSDLLAKVRWVMDPKHSRWDRKLQQDHAHHFCRTHRIWPRLAHDVLDVWEEYLRYLDIGDPDWQEQWKSAKQHLLHNNSNRFGFRPVTTRLASHTN